MDRPVEGHVYTNDTPARMMEVGAKSETVEQVAEEIIVTQDCHLVTADVLADGTTAAPRAMAPRGFEEANCPSPETVLCQTSPPSPLPASQGPVKIELKEGGEVPAVANIQHSVKVGIPIGLYSSADTMMGRSYTVLEVLPSIPHIMPLPETSTRAPLSIGNDSERNIHQYKCGPEDVLGVKGVRGSHELELDTETIWDIVARDYYAQTAGDDLWHETYG